METILEFVRRRLADEKGRLPTVASESGVPFGTLKKIACGDTRAPRIDTLERLASYFRGRSSRAA